MSEVRLMLGDCLERMKEIEAGTVDLILADLPYGTTQCAWDEVIPMAALWEQYLRVAKQEAAIVLTAAQPFTSALVMSRPDLFRYEWIWEKGHATGHLNAKKQPLRAHESALVFYRKQPAYMPQMTFGHERKTAVKRGDKTSVYGTQAFAPTVYDSTERYPRSVQFFSSDKQTSRLHPTQKPVALMEYLIRTYAVPGMTVLDNTMGSGTTGVAALRCGCNFIGIELDPEHFATAESRISDEAERLATPVPQFDMFAEVANG
jgi:DNA modification methylase